jgi:hypothetical protein
MFGNSFETSRSSSAHVQQATASHPRNQAHDDFVRMVPLIRTHARYSFRKKLAEEQEELIAECLANAFRAYVRLLELNKQDLIYPTVLAKFAVKQVRSGRKVGGCLNCNDVLSGYAQLRRDITVERLDRYDTEAHAWQEAVVADTRTPVPEQAAFRLDFSAWLKQHQPPKRRIAAALALGYTTGEVAQRFHVSPGRISQLRRDFAQSWAEFQGAEAAQEEELAVA